MATITPVPSGCGGDSGGRRGEGGGYGGDGGGGGGGEAGGGVTTNSIATTGGVADCTLTPSTALAAVGSLANMASCCSTLLETAALVVRIKVATLTEAEVTLSSMAASTTLSDVARLVLKIAASNVSTEPAITNVC